MSREDVEIVEGIISLFRDQEWVSFVRDAEPEQMQAVMEAVYDPDVEITWVDTSPDAGPYHGHEGALAALHEWLESFEEFRFEPLEFIDAGSAVVVPNVQRGKGRGSGAPVEMTATWVVTVRDAKISRLREYSTKARALEAAGVRE